MMKVRVAVFDDSKTLRNGLQLLINSSEKLTSNTVALKKAGKLFREMNKVAEDLLKPESTEENLPYELTQEGYLRKKRKQGHRHKR